MGFYHLAVPRLFEANNYLCGKVRTTRHKCLEQHITSLQHCHPRPRIEFTPDGCILSSSQASNKIHTNINCAHYKPHTGSIGTLTVHMLQSSLPPVRLPLLILKKISLLFPPSSSPADLALSPMATLPITLPVTVKRKLLSLCGSEPMCDSHKGSHQRDRLLTELAKQADERQQCPQLQNTVLF